MTACNIRPDGSHIHGARYVDRWTAIVANAFRFNCYRRVRPLTVGERWGKSTRLEKTSIQAFHTSLPRFGVIAHSSIPSPWRSLPAWTSEWPRCLPRNCGPTKCGGNHPTSEWCHCHCQLPMPRPREPSPKPHLRCPRLIQFKTSDLFASYVIFDETICPALSRPPTLRWRPGVMYGSTSTRMLIYHMLVLCH